MLARVCDETAEMLGLPMGAPQLVLDPGSQMEAEQLRRTGAEICVAPCANCKKQLKELVEHYQLPCQVMGLHDLILRAIIIPGTKSTMADLAWLRAQKLDEAAGRLSEVTVDLLAASADDRQGLGHGRGVQLQPTLPDQAPGPASALLGGAALAGAWTWWQVDPLPGVAVTPALTREGLSLRFAARW